MTRRRAVVRGAHGSGRTVAPPARGHSSSPATPQVGPYESLLNLQRLAGNRAVASAIQRIPHRRGGVVGLDAILPHLVTAGTTVGVQRQADEEVSAEQQAEAPDIKQELARVLKPQANWSKARKGEGPVISESEERAMARAAKAGKLLKGVGPEGGEATDAGTKANDMFKKGWLAELRITSSVEAAIDMHGGQREGGDFVQKDTGSLAEKVGRGKDINDSVRYTTTFDPGTFTQGTKSIFRELEKRGFEKVAVRNTFTDKSKVYRGINTNWRYQHQDPDLPSPTFEVQFHTAQSFDVKQTANHVLYEESRKSKDPKRKAELEEQMMANSDKIVVPEGVEEIKNYPEEHPRHPLPEARPQAETPARQPV